MNLKDLLVSNLSITEDNYCYKGIFTLSDNRISINIDVSDLDNFLELENIRQIFGLSDSPEEVRGAIMEKVMEKASISSKCVDGQDYYKASNENKSKNSSNASE